MHSPAVILLRGIPGAGKSTTSALIRDALQPAVRVSNDDVRYLAKPRDFTAFTLKTSEDACMELASAYVERGFNAVVDGVFYDTEFLAAWAVTYQRRGIPFSVITLTLTLEDLLMRNATREETARMPVTRLRDLHSGFDPFGYVLDIKENLPEEIAADVVDIAVGHPASGPGGVAEDIEVMFLRHGQPAYPNGIYPNHLKLPLSELGRAESRAARHAVDRFGPDAVFTSDMLRSIETAAIAAPDKTPTVEPALRERTFPELYGKPLDTLAAEYGNDVEGVLAGNSDSWQPDHAETLAAARSRVSGWVESVRSRRDIRRVLVVGHGGPHAWLLEQALGIDLASNRTLRFETGHFTKFRISESTVSVDYINRAPDGAY